MKKVRLYEVTVKDGYGSRMERIAGINKRSLKAELDGEHIVVDSIKHYGWGDVSLSFSEADVFHIEVRCKNVTQSFSEGDAGFQFLRNHYPSEIKNAELPDDM